MKPLIALSLAVLLAGCAATPSTPPPNDPQLAWERHAERLRQLNHWQLRGRLAIQSEGEGWQLSMEWRQAADDYDIRLRGPLGQGAVRLQGNEFVVVLDDGSGRTTLDSSPEQLLERQLGWPVPVTSLRYWVTGLPAPGDERHRLDAYGRLASLEQADWSLRIDDYQAQQLPRKLTATRNGTTVKLIISEWRLGVPEATEQ